MKTGKTVNVRNFPVFGFFTEIENKFTNHLHKIADIEVDFSFVGTTMGSVRGVRK